MTVFSKTAQKKRADFHRRAILPTARHGFSRNAHQVITGNTIT
jgi:hypothetical protein